AVDAAVGAVERERHQLQVFRPRLEIVQRGGRTDGIAKGAMCGDVADELALEIDGAAVLQRPDVLGAGLAVAHVRLLRAAGILPGRADPACEHTQIRTGVPCEPFSVRTVTSQPGGPGACSPSAGMIPHTQQKASSMKTTIKELSYNDLAAVVGGAKSTGSADLDKALDRAKALVAQFA